VSQKGTTGETRFGDRLKIFSRFATRSNAISLLKQNGGRSDRDAGKSIY